MRDYRSFFRAGWLTPWKCSSEDTRAYAGDRRAASVALAGDQLSGDMLGARWLLIAQAQHAIPTPFLVVLLFWLTMLHVGFGLPAPRNATVITVLFISALSVSGAIFIVLEMNHPLSGMIKVSSAPLRKALEHLGQ